MPTDGKAVPRIKLPGGPAMRIHILYPWDRSAIRGDILGIPAIHRESKLLCGSRVLIRRIHWIQYGVAFRPRRILCGARRKKRLVLRKTRNLPTTDQTIA